MDVSDGGSACQEDIAKQSFKYVLSLLMALNLPVSRRFNAMHGINEIASMLVYMCANKSTFNAASRKMKKEAENESDIPTSQWVLGILRSVPIEEMERQCKKMLSRMVNAAFHAGMIVKTDMIAVDGKMVPFTGDMEAAGGNVTGGKPKGGTSWFFHLITAQIVTGLLHLTVAVERVTADRDAVACLEGILSTVSSLHLRPRLYLMDRGFFGIRVMEAMQKAGAMFLMPARKTQGILRAIEEFKRGARKRISRYTIKSAQGEFTFYLIIERRMRTIRGKRQWVYIVFATNVPRHRIAAVLNDVPETYKQRWVIENGYKSMDTVRAPTCTRNYGIRLLLFYLAALNCNLWYLANATAKEQAVQAGVPRKQAEKIHTVLAEFVELVMEMAAEILAAEGPEAWRYPDGGG